MNDTKEQIISLFSEIDRPGKDRVLSYLCQSTYFTAKCHSHHRFRGGLAMHSLGVYREMKAMNTGLPDESLRIVALLHDLCTSHHADYNHIGRGHHGGRSLALIGELGFQLTEEEKMAIRNARRDTIDKLKKAEKDGLSEDNRKDAEADLQKIHDKKIKEIEKLLEVKNKEIMTV